MAIYNSPAVTSPTDSRTDRLLLGPGETERRLHRGITAEQWWRQAVIYQIYPRSFASAIPGENRSENARGIGDIPGIIERIPYLVSLGVDAIWLSPFYPSPQRDAGYDVADYRAVDPLFGSLADAERLIDAAHAAGLRIIIDLVPNHSSWNHPWFSAALAAGPDSPERARFIFRRGTPATDGSWAPPNNWRSVFGGPAWTALSDLPEEFGVGDEEGMYYLHLFDSSQPDYNWDNEQVRAEFDDILRFWLSRGVDGFRVDVANALIKAAGLPDAADTPPISYDHRGEIPIAPMWDQDEVHDIYRRWRQVCEEFSSPGRERILVAEAWVDPLTRLARYVRADEMHQAFNFSFLNSPWDAHEFSARIAAALAANDAVGAPTTWVMSNHDVVRHASRLGLPDTTVRPNGIRPGDAQPDPILGLARARAATALMLALPGSAYLYQGEELGLPEVCDLPDAFRQDPAFFRTGKAEAGRDGCRIPLPWHSTQPGLGFSPDGHTWLPQPKSYADLAVSEQQNDNRSTLALYRWLLALRSHLRISASQMWICTPDAVVAASDGTPAGETANKRANDVLCLRMHTPGGVDVVVLMNFSHEARELRQGWLTLANSRPGAVQGDADWVRSGMGGREIWDHVRAGCTPARRIAGNTTMWLIADDATAVITRGEGASSKDGQ